MTVVNPPQQLRIPDKIFRDPELRAYFEQQKQILFQLWTRTGGNNDAITPQHPTAELEDISNSVNTSEAKILGYIVRNTTTGALVFASGSADGDVWHYYDGSTAHTPA